MKEYICINLHCETGKARGTMNPATPPVRATAICLANCEADCPKARAKFRITQWCWRIKTTQLADGGERSE